MTTLCCATSEPLSDTNAASDSDTKTVDLKTLLVGVRQLSTHLWSAYKSRRQRKIDRDAFRNLLTLDDELLDDIGVTRDSVRWAAQLPLNVNAAQALKETRRKQIQSRR